MHKYRACKELSKNVLAHLYNVHFEKHSGLVVESTELEDEMSLVQASREALSYVLEQDTWTSWLDIRSTLKEVLGHGSRNKCKA